MSQGADPTPPAETIDCMSEVDHSTGRLWGDSTRPEPANRQESQGEPACQCGPPPPTERPQFTVEHRTPHDLSLVAPAERRLLPQVDAFQLEDVDGEAAESPHGPAHASQVSVSSASCVSPPGDHNGDPRDDRDRPGDGKDGVGVVERP